jgi:hypothetical protein
MGELIKYSLLSFKKRMQQWLYQAIAAFFRWQEFCFKGEQQILFI